MTTDPFALFDLWFSEARKTELNDSNAMALATTAPKDSLRSEWCC